MSTRGNICIKVKEKDYEKINNILNKFLKQPISNNFPYLFIYNHHDSYPEGLGKLLIEKYNDYDIVLALILQGDCSWPEDPYTQRGETYSMNCPRVVKHYTEACQQEYLYVFENNIWTCFDYKLNKIDIK